MVAPVPGFRIVSKDAEGMMRFYTIYTKFGFA